LLITLYKTHYFSKTIKTKDTMSITKWALDPTHSEIQFKVKHLMISTVSGQFNEFSSRVETEGDDFAKAKINFAAEVNSISTNNEQRDAHLKNGDFFDATNHPQLTFTGSQLEKINDEAYKLEGTLTIKGISKKVILDVDFGGIMQDPWGHTRAGFTLSGKINRQDFGISFGAVTETGGLLLGDEVKINANVQFVKQTVAQAVEAV
jgi:polyisoprenoid-binding protein YceI